MYKLFVSFRYLRRNWLNLVGVAAVAIGVLVLICVLSVMKGFDQEFRARIRATISDLIIERWSDDTFDGYEELMASIEKLPHVVACAPQYSGICLIRLGKLSRYGQFNGVDLRREIRATDFGQYWRAWRGFEARQKLTSHVPSRTPEGHANLGPLERLPDLLSQMRKDDFDLLPAEYRVALRAWAAQQGFDLRAAFRRAEAATPEWGRVTKPNESPVFAGSELVVVGRDSAGQLFRLDVGDRLVVISARKVFDGQVFRACRVSGQFRSGLYEYDLRNVYLPLKDVQKFMGRKGRVTSVNVRLDSFEHAPKVRAALLGILTVDELARGLGLVRGYLKASDPQRLAGIRHDLRELRDRTPAWFAEGNPRVIQRTMTVANDLLRAMAAMLQANPEDSGALEGVKAFQRLALRREADSIGRHFRISTWEDKRRTFLRAVWLERRIMSFILFFVILIAGFLILSILHTTVMTKTKDIGILKAIGGSVGGIMSIFLLNGLLMGVAGSGIGMLGGLLITGNINKIEAVLARFLHFQLFPKDIYYLDRVPVDQDPFWSALTIVATAIVVSFLASAYPAWKAARMNPVEALRYE